MGGNAPYAHIFLSSLRPALCVVYPPSTNVIINVQIVAGTNLLLLRRKLPLGLLGHWLYDQALVGFNDITSGCNPGCNTEDSLLSLDGILFVPGNLCLFSS